MKKKKVPQHYGYAMELTVYSNLGGGGALPVHSFASAKKTTGWCGAATADDYA